MKLYSARICPFAQRIRALLSHFEQPFELREIDLADKPRDFTDISPTGKVPLLVDGALLLYESQVIGEYLAEKLEWQAAWPAGAAARARLRLGMKQFDAVLLPAFYRSAFAWAETRTPGAVEDADGVDAELAVLETTLVELMGEEPSLATFHFGPFWQRIDALRELSRFAELIDARPALRACFERAGGHAAVRATGQPPAELLAAFRDYVAERAR